MNSDEEVEYHRPNEVSLRNLQSRKRTFHDTLPNFISTGQRERDGQADGRQQEPPMKRSRLSKESAAVNAAEQVNRLATAISDAANVRPTFVFDGANTQNVPAARKLKKKPRVGGSTLSFSSTMLPKQTPQAHADDIHSSPERTPERPQVVPATPTTGAQRGVNRGLPFSTPSFQRSSPPASPFTPSTMPRFVMPSPSPPMPSPKVFPFSPTTMSPAPAVSPVFVMDGISQTQGRARAGRPAGWGGALLRAVKRIQSLALLDNHTRAGDDNRIRISVHKWFTEGRCACLFGTALMHVEHPLTRDAMVSERYQAWAGREVRVFLAQEQFAAVFAGLEPGRIVALSDPVCESLRGDVVYAFALGGVTLEGVSAQTAPVSRGTSTREHVDQPRSQRPALPAPVAAPEGVPGDVGAASVCSLRSFTREVALRVVVETVLPADPQSGLTTLFCGDDTGQCVIECPTALLGSGLSSLEDLPGLTLTVTDLSVSKRVKITGGNASRSLLSLTPSLDSVVQIL